MATKGSVNNLQHRSASTGNDSRIDAQYNEYLFNITQNSYDFVPVQSQSHSFNNNESRYSATDFDPDDCYQVRANRDMTINTAFERTFNYMDTTSEEEPQNHRWKTNSKNPKNADNSTLSLHIAEHENSIQSSRSVNPNTRGLSFGPPVPNAKKNLDVPNAKKNLDLSFVNDPLEPLRHVENEPVAAETMPFKTSQKFINVNSSAMKKIPPKPLPRSRTRQAIVDHSNVVNSISNDLQHLNVTRNLPDLERTFTIPPSDLERTTSSIFGSTSDARTILTDASVFLDGFGTSKESNSDSASLSTIRNDESTLNEGNHNFDAQQAALEPEVQPPRNEDRFAPTQQPPTCVMVKGDTVNENYELMKKLQKKGRKPELFDMEKFLCKHDDLNVIFYDPATQNSHHEFQQEQLSHASDGAELGRVYPAQYDGNDFQPVPQHDRGQQQHDVFDSTVDGDGTLQTSWKDEEETVEECLGHSTPIQDVTLEPHVNEVNYNFDAQQAVQEPQVQAPRSEIKFASTERPPTCVMVVGDTVTKLNEFLPYKEDVQVRPPYSQIEAYDNLV